MKIIDLLNKIANGEEVPKKIKIDNRFYYEYDKDIDYKSKDGTYLFDSYIQINKEDMNLEVEILEEEKQDDFTGFKVYQDGIVISSIDWAKEEKKIPENLNWKPKESMAGELTQKEQIEVIARRTEKLKKEFNNLLDYLKGKGE